MGKASQVSRTNSSWVSRRNLTRTTSQTPLGSLRSPIRNATRVLQSHVAVESSQVPKITEVCLFTKDLPAWSWTFFLKKLTFGNRLLILWCLTWSLKTEGLKEKCVFEKNISLLGIHIWVAKKCSPCLEASKTCNNDVFFCNRMI